MNKTIGLLLAAIVATGAVVVAIWQTGRVNEEMRLRAEAIAASKNTEGALKETQNQLTQLRQAKESQRQQRRRRLISSAKSIKRPWPLEIRHAISSDSSRLLRRPRNRPRQRRRQRSPKNAPRVKALNVRLRMRRNNSQSLPESGSIPCPGIRLISAARRRGQ